MSEFADDVSESVSILNSYKQQRSFSTKKRKRPNGDDSTFAFSGTIPLERRRSDRLLKVTPRYSYDDLIDEEVCLYFISLCILLCVLLLLFYRI